MAAFFRWSPVLAAIVLIILPFAAGGISGFATSVSPEGWYDGLRKPDWAPPTWLFGPVWFVLYLLMGIAAFLVWRAGHQAATVRQMGPTDGASSALTFFFLQLAVNAAWSPVFFGLLLQGTALIVIIVLVILIILTIRAYSRVSEMAAWLMMPYLGWAAFACVLNGAIWRLNM